MCENNNNNECSCYTNILNTIVTLQRQGDVCDDTLNSCDRPYLGCATSSCFYNTRPITFYSCGNTTLWTMPYTLNGQTSRSSVFRCEAVDGCCCTCRVFAPNPDEASENPYVSTNSLFTLNLNCVGAISCLPDTYVACI